MRSYLLAASLALGCTAIRRLPQPETTPSLQPSIAGGAAIDGALQLARAPWWLRLTVVPAGAATLRYSHCCRRGEGTGFGFVWGAGVAEVIGLLVRGHP